MQPEVQGEVSSVKPIIPLHEVMAAFSACPACHGAGFTVAPSMPHGEAEQSQCECSAIRSAIGALVPVVGLIDKDKFIAALRTMVPSNSRSPEWYRGYNTALKHAAMAVEIISESGQNQPDLGDDPDGDSTLW